MTTQYTILPQFYDILNADVNYEEYIDFIKSVTELQNKKVLDLGCGTGDMSILLFKEGADVVALDKSSEMLSLASHKADEKKARVFFTAQDMTSFSTGHSYDLIISTFDSLNYITSKAGLVKAFNCVSNELSDDGIFLFDMNSEYKFENIYSDNAYVLESGNVFCAWENYYDKSKKLCDFYINIFVNENGVYKRYYETQIERMFTFKEISLSLNKAGLKLINAYSDYEKNPISTNTERYYIIAKKI